MAFCTECGATIPGHMKFCTECGKPTGEAGKPASATAPAHAAEARTATQAPPEQAAYPVNTAGMGNAPPGDPYGVIGVGGYIGMIILFMIPVAGWIACLIMSFAARNRNRRNFARAML
ncbi:MAG: zinc ribbon domain-containing protein, partial [Oscillospiraceae bacterium]|nr:zinc ribbon domain-containing protein [Oscillospiraceae bacterium]